MGKVKQMRRKARELALKERRLQVQGALANDPEAIAQVENRVKEAERRGVLIGLRMAKDIANDARNIKVARESIRAAHQQVSELPSKEETK